MTAGCKEYIGSSQSLICLTKNQSHTSKTGGWCEKAVRKSHVTDNSLAGALADLFADRTVVGLGDGPGEYRKLILGTGKVRTYDAYDGAPNIDNFTNGQVIQAVRQAATICPRPLQVDL